MKIILQILCHLIVLVLGMYFCLVDYSNDIGANSIIKVGIFFLMCMSIVAVNLFFNHTEGNKKYWSRKTFGNEE